MVCQACLRENDPNAHYCCDCGRSLTGEPTETPEAIGVWSDRERRCAECGQTLPPGSRFCSGCGAAPAAARRRGNRFGLVVGMVVVVVLLAAAAALIVPSLFG